MCLRRIEGHKQLVSHLLPYTDDVSNFLRRFVVVNPLNSRHQTPVSRRILNPTYAAIEATFDFPIFLSLADRLGVVELVVWDKNTLKDYLGELAVPLED